MARLLPPDPSIVRLIETAQRHCVRAVYEWLPDEERAARRWETFDFAEGFATTQNKTPGSRVATVTVLDLDGAVTPAAIDDLVARLTAEAADTIGFRVPQTPGNAGIIAYLQGSGFQRRQRFVHWIAPTDKLAPETAATAEGHGVRRIAADQLPEFARLVCINYNRKPETAAALIHESTMPGMATFLAHMDGAAVGTGRMTCIDGVGSLGYGTTLKPFRGRGIQQAIIAARLRHAHESGCAWATASTMGFDRSSRNLARQGMSVAYLMAIYDRGR